MSNIIKKWQYFNIKVLKEQFTFCSFKRFKVLCLKNLDCVLNLFDFCFLKIKQNKIHFLQLYKNVVKVKRYQIV